MPLDLPRVHRRYVCESEDGQSRDWQGGLRPPDVKLG